ncbi:MAG: hypothetical protein ACREBG_09085 [Pyrinomonadaceae bacterium]
MDRKDLTRALAKAMAYEECGKEDLAKEWALLLILRVMQEFALERGDILDLPTKL